MSLNDNKTKRDENRGVIPLFAEPDGRVSKQRFWKMKKTYGIA